MRFADCASVQCPSYADLALALAGEFRPVDHVAAEAALRTLGERLEIRHDACPLSQLQQVTDAVGAALAPPARLPADDADFMLDAVLANRTGQPVMLAVVAAELGHRAGIPLGVVSDGRRHLIAHRNLRAPLLADFAAGGLRHAHELRADLNWHCAHQVACALLQNLLNRALSRGDLTRAMHAAELKLVLPFDRPTRAHARSDLVALRAQLN